MHTEIYKIKGREYKYQVKNYRVGKKVKHKKKYLGPVNPINNSERKKSSGRRPTIFVRHISGDEKQLLKKAVKSSNSFTSNRAKIVLLSADGLSPKQIVQKTSFEKRKVRKAIKDFNNKDLQALQRGKAKGATPKFTDMIKKIILMHFSKKPSEFGLHFTTWTLPRFKNHLIDYKVVDSISIEKLRQILMNSGAKLERSKRWQYSPDKEFHKKNLQ
jgi:hypothetical protein